MSAPTNRWKLGAFVLGTVLLGLAGIIALTAQTLQVVSVDYTSYFDESVNGLEVGSPVSFRGVKIGNVSVIDVAPDRRHVEIKYQLGVLVLKRLGLSPSNLGKETKITVPPELRVQIASTGLTGTKFLQLDFFGGGPPPALPFPVPENYIPAAQSTMKNLEDSIVRAVDQIPEITQQLAGITTRIAAILDDIGQRGLPAKASVTLDRANRLMAGLQDTVEQLHAAQLSHEATATMANVNVTLKKLNTTLDTLNGSDGLFASVQHTSDSLGEVAGPRLEQNLDETGRDLREAATAVRQLIEALQRDPDMLLKGKAK
jgi:phospholipid/cholesterol/gamma-HCH transport system substrate-binding protein